MADQPSSAFLLRGDRLLPAPELAVAATDRGFTLGDGVFETLRTAGGRPFLLVAHLTRLRAGLRRLDIRGGPTDHEVGVALTRAGATLAPASEAVVRLTVSRGPAAGRGLVPGDSGPPTVIVHVTPLLPAATERGGLRLIISAIRRNEGSPLSRIKSCNYLDNVLARQEAAAVRADDAVLLNNRGEIACASAANLFWVDTAGSLVTPPPACGVLPGVTRAVILQLARQAGMPWREEAVGVQAVLDGVREAFLTNSVRGIQPVGALAGQPVGAGAPGPVTRRLDALYADVVAAHTRGLC